MAQPAAALFAPVSGSPEQRLQQIVDWISRATVDIGLLQSRVQQLASRHVKAGAVALGNLTPPITSTVYVMAGMGVAIPTDQNTRAIAHIDGQIGNNANNGTTYVQLVGGTGTLPNRGDLLTSTSGTTLGQPVRFFAASANDYTPFAQDALATSMTPGTQYWVD